MSITAGRRLRAKWDADEPLGLPPRVGSGGHTLENAIAKIRDAYRAHGLVAGMHYARGLDAQARVSQGFRLATVGVDWSLFKSAARKELAEARRQTPQREGP